MTTHITKTWFDGKNIVTQEIPVGEVYKREWVGLTDEEINDAYRCAAEAINFCTPSHTLIVRAAEAKLKEKNNAA